MGIETITLHLPDTVIRRAKQAADVLHRPVEEVLATMLAAALPNTDDVPPDMQAELMRMTWLSDQELWAIARRSLPQEHQERLAELASAQAGRHLTPEEREDLDSLRREYGQETLRKARAYALLSLRAGRPLLTGS